MSIHDLRYWNEARVMAYLQDAAAIHRRLPPVKVPSYRTLWPETMKDSWEKLYDAINGKTWLGSPMPAEVSFSDEVLAWLRWLNRNHQQIVFMRANRIPWKVIVAEKQRSKQTLWRDMRYGLCQIAAMLHAKDPEGDHYNRLRLRANGMY